MKFLLIGGTSFMGPCVVSRLLALGHDVAVFTRGKTPCTFPEDVIRFSGDRRNLPASRQPLRDYKSDVVIDMMMLTEQDAQDAVRVFSGYAGRLVMISSQDVYQAYGRVNGIEPGPVDNEPITEESPLRTHLYPYRALHADSTARSLWDDYDKILAERVILSDPKISAVVIRLPMVYGPGDRQHRNYEYLRRMADGRPAILLEWIDSNWHGTRGYVDDMAHAIVLAAITQQATGRIYNVAEPVTYSTAEWVDMLGTAFGWTGRILRVPLSAEGDSSRDEVQHLIVSSDRIRSELHFIEPTPQDVRLKRTIDWELAHPPNEFDPATLDYSAEDLRIEALRLDHTTG